MTSPQLKAFSMVKRRLERARDKLRDTLAHQQIERDEANAQVATQRQEVARATGDVERIEARIDSLLDGRCAVRIDEMLSWQETLAQSLAQRTAALGMLQRLQEAVAAIEAKLAATRLDIVRHDTRVELCDARIDGLRREAEMRADDLQDEEAEEAFVGRKLAREAAAGKPVREASR
ncbi:hypothetical protein PQQ53_31385 [Paraburkholderia strydomiana]|jgi:type III secretion system HrpB7-like protein|uniref:Type III secretion protein HrpB7 n=1 Tax=Paraburkholderia strydomiana TaxID=1245417 RepID=A0ABW9EPV1_9BURK